MSRPVGGHMACEQGYLDSWHTPAPVNSGSRVSTDLEEEARRQLDAFTAEVEPLIKKERLDSSYERAMANQNGTLLGTIVPTISTDIRPPVSILRIADVASLRNSQPLNTRPRPRKIGNARQNKSPNVGSISSHNNTTLNRPVILLPRGAVPAPYQGSFPHAFLPRPSPALPNIVQISSRGLIPASAPISSSVGGINSYSNTVLNRPVVLLPNGAVVPPQQGSLPAFLPNRPVVVPNVRISTHPRTTVSAPVNNTTTPLVVLVSQPSTTGARIVCTSLTSADMTSSSTSRYTTIHLPSTSGASNTQVGPDPLAKLKAIFGKSVLDRYVGPEPPPELRMPTSSRHICHSCGDEFVTDVGLVDHMSRRSMLISFRCTCKLAKWPRQFYNPCTFESFYQLHSARPGTHASRDSVTISVLDLDTPEYRQCLNARNQQKNTAASEEAVSQSSENTNSNEQSVTTAAGSSSNSQTTCSVAPVKEVYVNLEVRPNERPFEQLRSSDNDRDTGTAVTKKTNENLVKSTSATKSGLSVKRRRPQSKLGDDGSLLTKVRDFSNALCHNRAMCQECLVDYKTRHELSAHFLANSGSETLRCTKCGLVLPTACSLSAHLRLHENLSPFVCPQCGIVFDEAESAEVFKAHVERRCFHLVQSSSGSSASNCPRCSFTMPEADEAKMAQHFIDAHAAVYYKCRSCPKAFVNDSAAEKHSETTGHDAQKDIVRKCTLCDAVFKDSAGVEMRSHVIEHLTAMKSLSFQCSICPVHSSRRSVAVEHLQSCHPDVILPATTCEVCGRPQANQEQLFTHISTKHVDYFQSVMKCLPPTADKSTSDVNSEFVANTSTVSIAEPSISASEVLNSTSLTEVSDTSTVSATEAATVSESELQSSTSITESFECARCQMKFSAEDTYKRHQAKHRFLEAKKARKKQTATESSEDPLQQVPIPKEKMCTRCSQTFSDVEVLQQHISTVHGSPGWHWCQLCADGFSTSKQLQRHVEIRHCGKIESSHAYVCPLCAKSPDNPPVSFTIQSVLTKHLRNVHGIPRIAAGNMARAAAPSAQTTDSEQMQDSASCSRYEIEPAKRLFVSGETVYYQCSRCDFSAEDRAQFVAHASKHSPSLAGAVQCKECAASFTVAAALYRHLRVTHRMDCDIDAYLQENGFVTSCSMPDTSTTDDEWTSPVAPSSCSSMMSSGGYGSESKPSDRKLVTPVKGDENDDDAPGECTVCYRVFTTKHLLRKHMRVHGMAFIQRTRRKLPVSSPVAGEAQS